MGDARVVVLAGDGPSFCAGADVEWQRSSIDLSFEENVEDALRLYRMLEAIDTCPAPVVGRDPGLRARRRLRRSTPARTSSIAAHRCVVRLHRGASSGSSRR